MAEKNQGSTDNVKSKKVVRAVAEALKADWETGPDLGPALYISTEYCCSNI